MLMFARADVTYMQLLFEAFQDFSVASGLSANLDKSNVYFCGISTQEPISLLEILHMPAGAFPFKYFGVPLAASELISNEYKPLVAKVTTRIQIWTAKKFSYAGRAQLVAFIL